MILLLAYFLAAQGFIGGKSVLFNAINATGSIFLIANSLSLEPKDWAVAVFNIVWLTIALTAILQAV